MRSRARAAASAVLARWRRSVLSSPRGEIDTTTQVLLIVLAGGVIVVSSSMAFVEPHLDEILQFLADGLAREER